MGEIEEMTYTRNHNFVPLGFKAIGEADSKYLTSFSFMLCCLKVRMIMIPFLQCTPEEIKLDWTHMLICFW